MRTLIVAIAVSVGESDTLNLPTVGGDFEEFKRFLTWTAQHPTIVGVLDRDLPQNNQEAQIFAAASAELPSSEASEGGLRCAC